MTTDSSTPQESSLAQQVMGLEKQYLLQNYGRYPLVIHRGKGCYVYDIDGKRYLDLIAGIGVNALGHAHPRIVKVIREQAALMLHSSNLYYHEYQGPLAKEARRDQRLAAQFLLQLGRGSHRGRPQDGAQPRREGEPEQVRDHLAR